MFRRLNKISKSITFRQIVRNLCTPRNGEPPKKSCETTGQPEQSETPNKPKTLKKNKKCPPKLNRSPIGATKPKRHEKKEKKQVEKRALRGKEISLKAPYWRNLSLGAVVFIICFTGYTFATLKKHEREPFVTYEYLRIRNKPSFFGDVSRTFFHNPKVNALKDGYEEE